MFASKMNCRWSWYQKDLNFFQENWHLPLNGSQLTNKKLCWLHQKKHLKYLHTLLNQFSLSDILCHTPCSTVRQDIKYRQCCLTSVVTFSSLNRLVIEQMRSPATRKQKENWQVYLFPLNNFDSAVCRLKYRE